MLPSGSQVNPFWLVGEFATHFGLPTLVVGLNQMFTGVWDFPWLYSRQPAKFLFDHFGFERLASSWLPNQYMDPLTRGQTRCVSHALGRDMESLGQVFRGADSRGASRLARAACSACAACAASASLEGPALRAHHPAL